MHRTEATNNVSNLYTDGPPATTINAKSLNAIQEEICNTIINAGLSLKTAADDTHTQLYEAIMLLLPGLIGYVNRGRFIYKNTDEIYIDPGVYHHHGTSNQIVKWEERLTFKFGPAGSNPDNDNFAGNTFFYLYLDDSAIVSKGNNIISNSELVAKTTAPTWVDSKNAWYNGLDRCIFAVFGAGAGAASIWTFLHNDNLVIYGTSKHAGQATKIDDDFIDIDIDVNWTNAYLFIPDFCTKSLVTFWSKFVDGTGQLNYHGGVNTNIGHIVCYSIAGTTVSINSKTVLSDSDGIIQVRHNASNGNTITVDTNGWYFPTGM